MLQQLLVQNVTKYVITIVWIPVISISFEFFFKCGIDPKLSQNTYLVCIKVYMYLQIKHSKMIVPLMTGICGKTFCIGLLPECLSTVKFKLTIDWLKSSEYASGQISAKKLFVCDWFIMFHVNYDEHFDWAYCQINSKFCHVQQLAKIELWLWLHHLDCLSSFTVNICFYYSIV